MHCRSDRIASRKERGELLLVGVRATAGEQGDTAAVKLDVMTISVREECRAQSRFRKPVESRVVTTHDKGLLERFVATPPRQGIRRSEPRCPTGLQSNGGQRDPDVD